MKVTSGGNRIANIAMITALLAVVSVIAIGNVPPSFPTLLGVLGIAGATAILLTDGGSNELPARAWVTPIILLVGVTAIVVGLEAVWSARSTISAEPFGAIAGFGALGLGLAVLRKLGFAKTRPPLPLS